VDHSPSSKAQPASDHGNIALGASGWMRFIWRQLTSMKTALFLLLLLALAAIPGSLVPQRSSDPNGVVRFEQDDPELFGILDSLQLFDTYSSVWFSAIYLLLFISLIGCILPRTSHHIGALRANPPKTPARFDRLEAHTVIPLKSAVSDDAFVAHAQQVLADKGYRTQIYGASIAAEKGYLRESANLLFHFALVGVLVSLAAGTGFKYSGQRVLVEGQSFTNDLASYDSFTSGAWFSEDFLTPFSLQLESFTPTYQFDVMSGTAEPLDFTAEITSFEDGVTTTQFLRVNQPLSVGGTSAYLLGNGFAPVITVKNPDGDVVFRQSVVFLPQDRNLTSLGVVKIPDGLDEQVGLMGFFYPSAVELESGAFTSVYPEPDQPMVSFNVFTGDLGLNEGIPRNVYSLDTESLTQVAGRHTGVDALVMKLGESAEIPGGLGTITFESLPRYISIDIHRDPTQLPVALFALLIVVGLVTSLFVVRRRVWVRLSGDHTSGQSVEVAALSRNEDPTQQAVVDEIAQLVSQGDFSRLKS
jgi:cytochrome c biogenesis protein